MMFHEYDGTASWKIEFQMLARSHHLWGARFDHSFRSMAFAPRIYLNPTTGTGTADGEKTNARFIDDHRYVLQTHSSYDHV